MRRCCSQRSGRAWSALVAIAACGVVTASLGVTAAVAGSRGRAATGGVLWIDRGVHVVGGPVAAAGRVLVLVTGADNSVWLEAVDPSTGVVKWRTAEGFSEITPGVVTVPLADAGVALALTPDRRSVGAVRLEGVAVSTGQVVWRAHSATLIADAPTNCPEPLGKNGFCLVEASRSSRPTLVALAPRTGAVLATVPNIQRLMSTQPRVYETGGKSPVLVGVSIPGGVRWTEPVSQLFGPGYNPNYGWTFDQYGSTAVGTVGALPVGKVDNLSAAKTIGLSAATGKRAWSAAGFFQCDGQSGLNVPYICRITGTATPTANGTLKTSKNATVTLEGFDPSTGRITWRLPASGLANLLLGNVAIKDDDDAVIQKAGGGRVVLNFNSGAVTPVTSNEVFWCAHVNPFKIQPIPRIPPERVGSSFYGPCDAEGYQVASTTAPSTLASAKTNHVIVWSSLAGLQAVRQQ